MLQKAAYKYLLFLFAALLFTSTPVLAFDDPLEELLRADSIDCVMKGAIASRLINGGVIIIGDSNDDLIARQYGRVSAAVDAPAIFPDTIFDLASLTKVIATAPAIMKLADEGVLNLLDPVEKWFPEFIGKGKDDLLLLNLLTHTSGLHDVSLPPARTVQADIRRAADEELKSRPGSRFRYADINFILLGELVRRATGQSLDNYVAEHILLPLGMTSTGFNPAESLYERCAATIADSGGILRGKVQDLNAGALGGVAGHAGLFGTAADLARFCRMLLRGGELEGRRVFSPWAVQQMASPFYFQQGRIVRGLGWDILSPYSSPRGNGFSSASFGHTGYSGCSIWIDPESDLFVVLLTSRSDYRRVGDFGRLRSSISTLAARIFQDHGNADGRYKRERAVARQKP
ncbi:MAG: serine hydrolase domain-containing protein [Geobacteraceae bacterium]|nr:serine hydrolase domain-containing protein [Geobacteraceae bacterium]